MILPDIVIASKQMPLLRVPELPAASPAFVRLFIGDGETLDHFHRATAAPSQADERQRVAMRDAIWDVI